MRRTSSNHPRAGTHGALVVVLVLLAAGSGSVIANAHGGEEWPMIGGNPQRTGSSGSVPGPGTGEVLWTHEAPHNVNQPPAYADGRLFVTYGGWHEGGGLQALDARTGDVLWQQESGPIHGTPLVSAGIVVVATAEGERTEGRVLAYDVQDGRLLWQKSLENGMAGRILIYEGTIYVGVRPPETFYGFLRAFNLASGASQWTIDAFNPGLYADDDRVVLSQSHGVIEALNPQTQDISWEYQTGKDHPSASSVSDGVAVVFGDDGPVALDVETGELLWALNATGVMDTSPVPIVGDLAVISGRPLQIVDVHTGEVRNTVDAWSPVGLAVQADTAYVSTYASTLYAPYDSSKWRVMAVDIHSGETHWTYSIPYTYGYPTVANGILYQPYSTSPAGDHDEPGGIVALDAGFLDAFGEEALRAPSTLLQDSSDGIEWPIPASSLFFLMAVLALLVVSLSGRNNGRDR